MLKKWIAVVLLISLSTDVKAVTNRDILGLWQFGTLSIEFRDDNTYTWRDESATLEGRYEVKGFYPDEGYITLYYKGDATHYVYSIKGSSLKLTSLRLGGPDRDSTITLTKIETPYLSKPQALFESPLIGVWINKEGNTTITLMFSKDGSYEVVREELTGYGKERTMNTGTYKIINSNITLISTDGERRTYSFSLKGDRLVMNEVVYVRKAKKKKEEEIPITAEKFYSSVFQTEDPTTILVAGSPPLTQEIVELYYNFFEYAAKTKLTEAQRGLIKNSLIKEFQQGNLKQRTEVLRIKETWNQVEMLDPGQREILRIQIAKELVTEAQKDPNNPTSQAILNLFSKVNTILVKGDPPLTQQVVDTYFEFVEFYSSVIQGEPVNLTDEEKNNFTQNLIKKYTLLSKDQKQAISNIDVEWAKFRYVWNTANQEKKEQLRKDLLKWFNNKADKFHSEIKVKKKRYHGYTEEEINKMSKKEFRKLMMKEQMNGWLFENTMNVQVYGKPFISGLDTPIYPMD